MKSITKAQLIAELEPFADDAIIKISVGAAQYPIEDIIAGSGAVWLEADIETPATMGAKGGRKITNNSPKAIRQREYSRRSREKKTQTERKANEKDR